MPPFPLWAKQGVNKRNTMAAAAGNRLLDDVIADIKGVQLVDYLTLARTFLENTAPADVHYLMVNDTGSYGPVGIAIADYVIQLLCEHLNSDNDLS